MSSHSRDVGPSALRLPRRTVPKSVLTKYDRDSSVRLTTRRNLGGFGIMVQTGSPGCSIGKSRALSRKLKFRCWSERHKPSFLFIQGLAVGIGVRVLGRTGIYGRLRNRRSMSISAGDSPF